MNLRLVLFVTCALACSWVGAAPAHADGKLSKARAQSRGSSGSSERHSSSHGSSSHSDSGRRHSGGHHDSWGGRSYSGSTGCGAFSCGYEVAPDAYYESDTYVSEAPPVPDPTYASYPYATSRSPYLLAPALQVASTSAELDAHLLAEHSAGQPFAGQLMLDAGYLSGIGQSSLNARVLMPGRFELSARNTTLWEPAERDYSLFGAALVGVRFMQAPAALMRLTAGLAYFGQFEHVEAGVELGIGMDVFLGRPWVLSASAEAAIVGQTFAPQARIQLGYLFGRSEVFVGYQFLQIGSVDLSTPLLGTRIWL